MFVVESDIYVPTKTDFTDGCGYMIIPSNVFGFQYKGRIIRKSTKSEKNSYKIIPFFANILQVMLADNMVL